MHTVTVKEERERDAERGEERRSCMSKESDACVHGLSSGGRGGRHGERKVEQLS